MPYLREQFKLIRPKIVVCLGRIAAQRLIRPDFSVMKEHGQWTEKNGTFFTAVSYTHLDVYKRQDLRLIKSIFLLWRFLAVSLHKIRMSF